MLLEDHVQPSRKGRHPTSQSLSSVLAGTSTKLSSAAVVTALDIASEQRALTRPTSARSTNVAPIFDLDRVQYSLDGVGTHLAVGDNTLYLVTNDSVLVRIDLTATRGVERTTL